MCSLILVARLQDQSINQSINQQRFLTKVKPNSRADKYTKTNEDQLKTMLLCPKQFTMIVKNTVKYLGNGKLRIDCTKNTIFNEDIKSLIYKR